MFKEQAIEKLNKELKEFKSTDNKAKAVKTAVTGFVKCHASSSSPIFLCIRVLKCL